MGQRLVSDSSGYGLTHGDTIWEMYATHGIPPEISLGMLNDKKLIPTWDTFFMAAKKNGANLDRIHDRMLTCIIDAYPERISKVINKYLHLIVRRIK